MNEYETKVRQFHEAMGVPANDAPVLMDPDTRMLRIRLLVEEVLELAEASGVRVSASTGFIGSRRVTVEVDPVRTPDITSMAQELADVQYVTSGAAITFGLPMGAVFNEVHEANMRKVGPDGKVVRRPDGKVIKPEGWTGPDVAAVLAGTK